MPRASTKPQLSWRRLKPDTLHAVEQLRSQLHAPDESSQDLLDAYLFAKRTLAGSMQALLRSQLPDSCPTFHDLREQLGKAIVERYSGRVPAEYLKVPYGSRTHEVLFSLLLERRGEPVPAMLLRVITADSVHTERRMRELRELGLDIDASQSQGTDVYTLSSLDLDPALMPVIVENLIKKDKSLDKGRKEALIACLKG